MRIQYFSLIILSVFFFISCKKTDFHSNDSNNPFEYIKVISVLTNDVFQLNIDEKNKEIKSKSPISSYIDLSKMKLSFKLKDGYEIKNIYDKIEISERDLYNFIFPYTIYIYKNGVKISQYIIYITKEVDNTFKLTYFAIDDGTSQLPFNISDDKVTNQLTTLDNANYFSNSSIVFSSSVPAKLYFEGIELPNKDITLNDINNKTIQLISTDGKKHDYLFSFNSSFKNNACNVSINKSDIKQKYVGGGFTFNLYHGHIFSMSQENQDLYYKLIFKDIDIKYILYNLKINAIDSTTNLDMFSHFLDNAKKYRPDLNVILILADFPDNLKKTITQNNNEISVLDIDRGDEIYNQLAQWAFEFIKALKQRGHDVDILSMCNEPDWEKRWLWGYEDSRVGIANMIKGTIPKLKELISNSVDVSIMPKVLAPSNITPAKCLDYLNFWKEDINLWNLIDIFSTHQYVNGVDEYSFKQISESLGDKDFIQSEQHVNKGDNFNKNNYSREQHSIISLTSMFDVAVNNGVSSWCYFVSNVPMEDSDVGLLRIAWNGNPEPFKQYYTYKQLNSLYDDEAIVLNTQSTNKSLKIVAMKSQVNDDIIIHLSNISKNDIDVILNLNFESNFIRILKTDEISNMECIEQCNIESIESTNMFLSLSPLSLYSVVLHSK